MTVTVPNHHPSFSLWPNSANNYQQRYCGVGSVCWSYDPHQPHIEQNTLQIVTCLQNLSSSAMPITATFPEVWELSFKNYYLNPNPFTQKDLGAILMLKLFLNYLGVSLVKFKDQPTAFWTIQLFIILTHEGLIWINLDHLPIPYFSKTILQNVMEHNMIWYMIRCNIQYNVILEQDTDPHVWHGGALPTVVLSPHRSSRAFLCRVCMFSPCS